MALIPQLFSVGEGKEQFFRPYFSFRNNSCPFITKLSLHSWSQINFYQWVSVLQYNDIRGEEGEKNQEEM